MSKLETGDPAPELDLQDQRGEVVRLSRLCRSQSCGVLLSQGGYAGLHDTILQRE